MGCANCKQTVNVTEPKPSAKEGKPGKAQQSDEGKPDRQPSVKGKARSDKSNSASPLNLQQEELTMKELEEMAMMFDQENLVVVDSEGFVSSFVCPAGEIKRSSIELKQTFMSLFQNLITLLARPSHSETLGRSQLLPQVLHALNSSTKCINVDMIVKADSSRVFYVGQPWIMASVAYNCFFDDDEVQFLHFIINTEHRQPKDMREAEVALRNFISNLERTSSKGAPSQLDDSLFNPDKRLRGLPSNSSDNSYDLRGGPASHERRLLGQDQKQTSKRGFPEGAFDPRSKAPSEELKVNIFGVQQEKESQRGLFMLESSHSSINTQQSAPYFQRPNQSNNLNQRKRRAMPKTLRIIARSPDSNGDGELTGRPDKPLEESTGFQPQIAHDPDCPDYEDSADKQQKLINLYLSPTTVKVETLGEKSAGKGQDESSQLGPDGRKQPRNLFKWRGHEGQCDPSTQAQMEVKTGLPELYSQGPSTGLANGEMFVNEQRLPVSGGGDDHGETTSHRTKDFTVRSLKEKNGADKESNDGNSGLGRFSGSACEEVDQGLSAANMLKEKRSSLLFFSRRENSKNAKQETQADNAKARKPKNESTRNQADLETAKGASPWQRHSVHRFKHRARQALTSQLSQQSNERGPEDNSVLQLLEDSKDLQSEQSSKRRDGREPRHKKQKNLLQPKKSMSTTSPTHTSHTQQTATFSRSGKASLRLSSDKQYITDADQMNPLPQAQPKQGHNTLKMSSEVKASKKKTVNNFEARMSQLSAMRRGNGATRASKDYARKGSKSEYNEGEGGGHLSDNSCTDMSAYNNHLPSKLNDDDQSPSDIITANNEASQDKVQHYLAQIMNSKDPSQAALGAMMSSLISMNKMKGEAIPPYIAKMMSTFVRKDGSGLESDSASEYHRNKRRRKHKRADQDSNLFHSDSESEDEKRARKSKGRRRRKQSQHSSSEEAHRKKRRKAHRRDKKRKRHRESSEFSSSSEDTSERSDSSESDKSDISGNYQRRQEQRQRKARLREREREKIRQQKDPDMFRDEGLSNIAPSQMDGMDNSMHNLMKQQVSDMNEFYQRKEKDRKSKRRRDASKKTKRRKRDLDQSMLTEMVPQLAKQIQDESSVLNESALDCHTELTPAQKSKTSRKQGKIDKNRNNVGYASLDLNPDEVTELSRVDLRSSDGDKMARKHALSPQKRQRGIHKKANSPKQAWEEEPKVERTLDANRSFSELSDKKSLISKRQNKSLKISVVRANDQKANESKVNESKDVSMLIDGEQSLGGKTDFARVRPRQTDLVQSGEAKKMISDTQSERHSPKQQSKAATTAERRKKLLKKMLMEKQAREQEHSEAAKLSDQIDSTELNKDTSQLSPKATQPEEEGKQAELDSADFEQLLQDYFTNNNTDNYFKQEQLEYYATDYAEKQVRQEMAQVREFKLGKMIGCGSFGNVFEGIDLQTGRPIAIKQALISSFGAVAESQQRRAKAIRKEIQLLRDLNHANIVKYLGTVEDGLHINVILEYVAGGTLQSLYKSFDFNESLIAKYTKQILLGLEYLHQNNIVHRDIKAANILVMDNGECKLADFGSSRYSRGVPDLHSFCGSPFWMAPEVVKQAGHNRFADIWSLGCTVYEMLLKRPPWKDQETQVFMLFQRIAAEGRPAYPAHISREMKDFMDCCFAYDRTDRANVYELLRHPFILRTPLEQPMAHKLKLEVINEDASCVSDSSPLQQKPKEQGFFPKLDSAKDSRIALEQPQDLAKRGQRESNTKMVRKDFTDQEHPDFSMSPIPNHRLPTQPPITQEERKQPMLKEKSHYSSISVHSVNRNTSQIMSAKSRATNNSVSSQNSRQSHQSRRSSAAKSSQKQADENSVRSGKDWLQGQADDDDPKKTQKDLTNKFMEALTSNVQSPHDSQEGKSPKQADHESTKLMGERAKQAQAKDQLMLLERNLSEISEEENGSLGNHLRQQSMRRGKSQDSPSQSDTEQQQQPGSCVPHVIMENPGEESHEGQSSPKQTEGFQGLRVHAQKGLIAQERSNVQETNAIANSDNSLNLNSEELQKLQSFMRDSSQGTSSKTPPSAQMMLNSRDRSSMSGSFSAYSPVIGHNQQFLFAKSPAKVDGQRRQPIGDEIHAIVSKQSMKPFKFPGLPKQEPAQYQMGPIMVKSVNNDPETSKWQLESAPFPSFKVKSITTEQNDAGVKLVAPAPGPFIVKSITSENNELSKDRAVWNQCASSSEERVPSSQASSSHGKDNTPSSRLKTRKPKIPNIHVRDSNKAPETSSAETPDDFKKESTLRKPPYRQSEQLRPYQVSSEAKGEDSQNSIEEAKIPRSKTPNMKQLYKNDFRDENTSVQSMSAGAISVAEQAVLSEIRQMHEKKIEAANLIANGSKKGGFHSIQEISHVQDLSDDSYDTPAIGSDELESIMNN